jgi:hypothetical protein
MSDTTDLVDRQIGAYQERDLGAFLACYAKMPGSANSTAASSPMAQTACARFYEPLFRDSPGLKPDLRATAHPANPAIHRAESAIRPFRALQQCHAL